MPNYAYVTFPEANLDLQSRLFQTATENQQFWNVPELNAYLVEALRTWNALTSFWRSEMAFQLAASTYWYDLTAQVDTTRPYTVTDDQMFQMIEYHLLEPLTTSYPLTWTGSQQFDLASILGAWTRRQNETLGLTNCTLARSLVNAPVSPGRVFLADTLLNLRRVAWMPQSGFGYDNNILRQSDIWAESSFDYGATTAGAQPPETWLQSSQPPPSFDVDYTPPVPGQYEVISALAGPTSSTAKSTLLTIPDDWTWVPKWGALMDLLGRESNSKDVARAAYCEARYRQGLAVLTDATCVLGCRLNNQPLPVDSVVNGDNFNARWQSATTPPQPKSIYTAGMNLVALSLVAANQWGVSISCVQNAPVTGQYLQISRDNYDVILDYAQHLAAFKMGGREFSATMPLYQGFLSRAVLYNSKLKAMAEFWRDMSDLSRLETMRNPLYGDAAPPNIGKGMNA